MQFDSSIRDNCSTLRETLPEIKARGLSLMFIKEF